MPRISSDQPTGQPDRKPASPQAPMAPGDDAPPGVPGTGENVCPSCGGSGKVGGQPCIECAGTGRVNVGIGGG